MIQALGFASRTIDVTTIDVTSNDNPTKAAIVEFTTKSTKIDFYKKVNRVGATWNNLNDMRFKDYDTIEKRINKNPRDNQAQDAHIQEHPIERPKD